MKRFYVICYDISNNKCRRRVEKILSRYGKRLQYSLFQVHLKALAYQALMKRLNKESQQDYFDPEHDKIYSIMVCEACLSKMIQIGAVEALHPDYMII